MREGVFRSRIARSAFLPASIEPISFSSPSAFAPLMVAMRKPSFALTHCGVFPVPLWISVSRLSSWNMFRQLLLAAPSVPRQTLTPASSIFAMGAKPFPSFILLAGLVTTLTFFRFRISISSSVTCTQWAAIAGTSKIPHFSASAIGVQPYFS